MSDDERAKRFCNENRRAILSSRTKRIAPSNIVLHSSNDEIYESQHMYKSSGQPRSSFARIRMRAPYRFPLTDTDQNLLEKLLDLEIPDNFSYNYLIHVNDVSRFKRITSENELNGEMLPPDLSRNTALFLFAWYRTLHDTLKTDLAYYTHAFTLLRTHLKDKEQKKAAEVLQLDIIKKKDADIHMWESKYGSLKKTYLQLKDAANKSLMEDKSMKNTNEYCTKLEQEKELLQKTNERIREEVSKAVKNNLILMEENKALQEKNKALADLHVERDKQLVAWFQTLAEKMV